MDPKRNPSIIYVPFNANCDLMNCDFRGRSTLCYLDFKTCSLYTGDFREDFRNNEGDYRPLDSRENKGQGKPTD